MAALEALVEPATRGDPESPLRWTCKSTRRLADELRGQRHSVSAGTVALLLRKAGYSLQANRKTREGTGHPDRNAQFLYINTSVQRFLRRGQPAVSVDTKKKELVGDFKNGGREWHPEGIPEQVRVHDFLIKNLGKAIPYGVYDMLHNQGWVSVGIDDTRRKKSASCGRLESARRFAFSSIVSLAKPFSSCFLGCLVHVSSSSLWPRLSQAVSLPV